LQLAIVDSFAVNPNAISIAEEGQFGMPGFVERSVMEGIGFDYRMAMRIPDFWIKTLKQSRMNNGTFLSSA